MEGPILNRYSIGPNNNSTKINQLKYDDINIFESINNNNNKVSKRPMSKSCTLSNTNYDENTKKTNSTFKTKSREFIKQRSTTISKKNKSTKNMKSNYNFSRFDSQYIEYNIQKNLSRFTNYKKDQPFLSRMEMDIKSRQSKDGKRTALLEQLKPKVKEEKRIKCFNRLINDSNRRNRIKENIENQYEFFNCGITPQKMSKKKWDIIYDNRFRKYQEKIDSILREKIIENERKIMQKEEEIVEQINSNTKKVSKKELDKIVNRLYLDSKKKNNKELENLISFDKDTPNGMKKDDLKEDEKNLTRGEKRHGTTQSTKIREKKNSYFGSVIIKTSTFEQGKTNSLVKIIQNLKSDKTFEKRPTLQPDQKEIKEMENENLNLSNLSNSKINEGNNIKKKKHVNFENIESMCDIWAHDVRIKKSQSLKRILVNDFNDYNMKFNINYKKSNKKIDNGINIINIDYYKNIDEDNNNNPDIKKNDLNINDFVINDLKDNMNGNSKINKYKHFNSPRQKNIVNIKNSNKNNNNISKNNINNNNMKNNKQLLTDKKLTKENNNNKKYIDELTAMKIVENVFVNKIKDK